MIQQNQSRRVAANLLLFLSLAGCADRLYSPIENSQDQSRNEVSLHAIMSDRLTVDSAQLTALLFDLHRTETELSAERGRQLLKIADTAGRLKQGAELVSGLSAQLALSPGDVGRFSDLAEQLQTQAGQLKSDAESGRLTGQQMKRQLARLNNTCSACHSLYRKTGDLLR